ncbi:hypothetical protein [Shimia sp. Alg240-R146]|uniref:hypothetical protein n=1 Tax=Shimia sp. Alg240-R146 TaxID=2993449 RepID=UPI0022E48425|nr:hypothetical protein [Shimia sp. Alg240-R146]
MPQKRFRSPQEKKRLSYEKDRRDTYGENNKSSRKNVPRGKAIGNRALRRAGNGGWIDDPDRAEDEFRKKAQSRFKKAPHAPLGDVVQAKISRRLISVGAKQMRRDLKGREATKCLKKS